MTKSPFVGTYERKIDLREESRRHDYVCMPNELVQILEQRKEPIDGILMKVEDIGTQRRVGSWIDAYRQDHDDSFTVIVEDEPLSDYDCIRIAPIDSKNHRISMPREWSNKMADEQGDRRVSFTIGRSGIRISCRDTDTPCTNTPSARFAPYLTTVDPTGQVRFAREELRSIKQMIRPRAFLTEGSTNYITIRDSQNTDGTLLDKVAPKYLPLSLLRQADIDQLTEVRSTAQTIQLHPFSHSTRQEQETRTADRRGRIQIPPLARPLLQQGYTRGFTYVRITSRQQDKHCVGPHAHLYPAVGEHMIAPIEYMQLGRHNRFMIPRDLWIGAQDPTRALFIGRGDSIELRVL